MSKSSFIHSDLNAGGYLSDVQSLHHTDSTYHYENTDQSEVSSDLIETTKFLDKQFQQRYKILKTAYEDRIQQLSLTLEETCNHIASNEIIESLKEDPDSSIFVPNFIQDILFSHLKSDREKYILDILNYQAELKHSLHNQKQICEEQNETILSLQEEVDRGKEAEEVISSMKKQLQTLNEHYQQLSEQATDKISTAIRQKEAAELKETSLREQLRHVTETLQEKSQELEKSRSEMDHKTKEIFELEKNRELSGKDLIHREASESRYKMDLERLTQKYQAVCEQKDSLQRDALRLQESNRIFSSDLEKLHQSEMTLIQENKKCKQHVTEIMKKVERMLEEEATDHEVALESYKRKVMSLKEKYESDLQIEKTRCHQKETELKLLREQLEEKKKELKSCSHDIQVLKEDCHVEYEKQMTLRKRIEELISESKRNQFQVTEEKKRVHQLETEMSELITRHHREVQSIREEMRLECQQKMEKERNLLERKSDVYRMKYENDFQEYLHSRNVDSLLGLQGQGLGQGQVSRSVESVRTSYPPPPPPPPPPHTQHNNEYENQIQSLRDHLGKAEVSIERLKRMVLEGKESVSHYKQIAEDLKNQLKLTSQRLLLNKSSASSINEQLQSQPQEKWNERSMSRSSHERFLASTHTHTDEVQLTSLPEDILKIHNLENEIQQLQQQLQECQQNALHEQEEDSKLLQEMQRKFDILMDKYETSAGEKAEEMKELKRVIGEYEEKEKEIEEMEKLKRKFQEISEKESAEKLKLSEENIELRKLIGKKIEENEMLEKSFREEVSHHEEMLQVLETEKQDFEVSSEKKWKQKFEELEQRYVLEKNKWKEELKLEQQKRQESHEQKICEVKELTMKRVRLSLKKFYEKIFAKYEMEIETLKRFIKKLKSNMLLLQSSMESEVEMIRSEWSYVCKRFQERLGQELEEKFRKQLLSINEIQMERELNLMKYSNTSVGTSATTHSNSNSSDYKSQQLEQSLSGNDSTLAPSTSISTSGGSGGSGSGSVSFQTIEVICNGYHSLLFQIFNQLQSSSLLTDGSCRDLRYLLTSLPSQIILTLKQHTLLNQVSPSSSSTLSPSLPSLDSLGYSLVTAKLIDILSRGMKDFLSSSSSSLQEQIQFLSNELRKEKIKCEEVEKEYSMAKKLNKENIGMGNSLSLFDPNNLSLSRISSSNTSGRGGDISTSVHLLSSAGPGPGVGSLENEEKQYYLTQINHLTLQIQELKAAHKQEIDRIKAEATMKENLLQDKIESLSRVSRQRNEDGLQEMESKLRSEQTRRQHLQTRLLAEESTHRKEVEELERRCQDFQRRAERAELEISKLRISVR